MMLLLSLCVAVCLPPISSDVIPVRGEALKKFEKSGGRSHLGRLVEVYLPKDVLQRGNIEKGAGGKELGFKHRNVYYTFDRDNPYVTQAQRKANSKNVKNVLLRGLVREIPGDEGPMIVVEVTTAQVVTGVPKRKTAGRG